MLKENKKHILVLGSNFIFVVLLHPPQEIKFQCCHVLGIPCCTELPIPVVSFS